MKIYVEKINLKLLNDGVNNYLKDVPHSSNIYIEVYTDEGIYEIDNNNIYSLDPVDAGIVYYNSNIRLVIDRSYFNRTLCTCINGSQHISRKIQKYAYKLNAKSIISFVIEMAYDTDDKQTPYDVYFESKEIVDIPFVKQDIIEFLSLLNLYNNNILC